MSDIATVDKNFKIETAISKSDIKFYDVRVSPFKVYGVFYENGKFRRMPQAAAMAVTEGVHFLHANTAGGRVRFRTNSPYIAINTKMPFVGKMSHFALCGSSGFDLYVGGVYKKSYVPPFDIVDGYEGTVELGSEEMREIEINFPLYSEVSELYIGLSESAEVLEPIPYRIEKPIVFYGSSITQGGCASRPGTCYQGFLSRWLDADYINLGFSGNARAEDEMTNYISGIDMSVFVCDYDHNSPNKEHLLRTHEKMFLKVREANPTLPIVLVSMPSFKLESHELERLEIIRRTYENALARGDDNVYLIDGRDLMRIAGNEGTVDGCHPTDLGFFSMASGMYDVLKKILE